jgi:hypothetical protein
LKNNSIIFVILLTLCYSCTGQNKYDEFGIVGIWRLCKEYHNIQATRNYCPEVVFSDDKSGTIEDIDDPSVFYWKIEGDILIINFQKEEESFFYKQSDKFHIEFYEEQGIEFLKLTSVETSGWYLLMKKK